MKKFYFLFVLAMFSTCLQAQSITSSVSFTQSDANSYAWPINISGGSSGNPVIVTLGENITIDQNNQYFIIQSDYVILEGNDKTITVDNIEDDRGLVRNGDDGEAGFNFITVNNIKMLAVSSTIFDEAGWVGQRFFGNTASNNIISNCLSNGPIKDFGGGITGNSSSCAVSRSHSSGAIGFAAGGIFGAGGTGLAINCYSTGNINVYGGGIFGFNSAGNATDCYSTGDMNSHGAGIAAYYSSGTITGCYSNSRNFNVQHSRNGNSWTTIGSVAAAGNNNTISYYNFLHADPVTGNNFYRIQQTDLDGKYTYSSVQMLQITATNKTFRWSIRSPRIQRSR
jgi:hypothetical protein